MKREIVIEESDGGVWNATVKGGDIDIRDLHRAKRALELLYRKLRLRRKMAMSVKNKMEKENVITK